MTGPPPTSEQLLRRYVDARDRGEDRAAERAWVELVTLEYDRIDGFVAAAAYRHLEGRHEREDALQLALTKILYELSRSFRGSTMGEWVKATRTASRYACLEIKRREARHHGKVRRLTFEDQDGDPAERDRDLYEASVRACADEQERREDEARLAEQMRLLAGCLHELTPGRRRVLELTLRRMPSAEIAERLGMSVNAVDQNRRRALQDVEARLTRRGRA